MSLAATGSFVGATSTSRAHAAARARALYRAWYREAPKITSTYLLDIPVHQVRDKIREEFTKHAHVQNVGIIDVLLAKGAMEFDETRNVWKQKTHVMRYFTDVHSLPPQQDFLTRFYQGRA